MMLRNNDQPIGAVLRNVALFLIALAALVYLGRFAFSVYLSLWALVQDWAYYQNTLIADLLAWIGFPVLSVMAVALCCAWLWRYLLLRGGSNVKAPK